MPEILEEFKKVSAADWETSRILIWQKQNIDRAAEQKRIKWTELKQLMLEWVGKDGFGAMTRREGMVVIDRLRLEGYRGMR